ncbi:MAG: FkbM family methyltransferase [Pseudomonadota bacterium]
MTTEPNRKQADELKEKLRSDATYREAFFDAHDAGLLLAQGKEIFIVNAQDTIISKTLFVDGAFDFEKFERAATIAKVDSAHATLIDVGANLGSICIPALARNCVKHAVAIEPEPQNFKLLRTNAILNGVDSQMTVHQTALGSHEDRDAVFELSKNNFGDHRIFSACDSGRFGEAERERIHVNISTLDKVVAPVFDQPLFLWIDTQGYEGHILAGAPEILKIAPPAVIEFWPYGLKRANGYERLKEALKGSNYTEFVDLDGDNPNPVALTDENLDRIYRALGENWPFTDLLLMRS